MTKKKTKKRKPKMPALSALDKAVYAFLAVLWNAYCAFLALAHILLYEHFTFADPEVVAYSAHASILWSLPLLFVLILLPGTLLFSAYESKQPIFGKKNILYGPPKWAERYPLFMKDRPKVYRRPAEMRVRKTVVIIAGAAVILSVFLASFSFYGKDLLLADGSIRVCSMTGSELRRYRADEVEKLTFATYDASSKHTYDESFRVEMKMADGRSYSFTYSEFAGDRTQTLQAMLALKARYPARMISYERTEKLPVVVSKEQFTPEQAELLYELFAMEKPSA